MEPRPHRGARDVELLHIRWIIALEEGLGPIDARPVSNCRLPVLEHRTPRPLALLSPHILWVSSLATAEVLLL